MLNLTTPRKHCPKCNKDLPATPEYFSRSKRNNDGLHSICKPCDSARSVAYQKANKERVNAKNRTWMKGKPGYETERKRKARLADPEKFKERTRNYRESYPEKVKQSQDKWRINNLEKARRWAREYVKGNPDKARVVKLRYRARKKGLPDTFTRQQWENCLTYFMGCCAVCERPMNGFFHKPHADHWIPISNPDCPGTVAQNIVPLCGGQDGCNQSKGGKLPDGWLVEKFGKRKAKQIMKRIQAYFDDLR